MNCKISALLKVKRYECLENASISRLHIRYYMDAKIKKGTKVTDFTRTLHINP